MGDTKNLSGKSAIDKLKEMAEEKICLFCTYNNGDIDSRPMSTQKVEDDGIMWFMSSKDSTKNLELQKDGRVHLMYSDPSKSHYLSIAGYAEIVHDRDKIEELWNPIAKAWFEEGKEDPDITLLKVHPEEGHYWDTKNGKLVSLIKIATAALTGHGMDGGIEGNMKL
ncbi:MAG: pyridoxamine 5'-phosphate oxidase family protein [Ferruginibacter sp.]